MNKNKTLEQVKSELVRDRLTREFIEDLDTDEMVTELHALEDALDAAEAERDRMRYAMEKIQTHPNADFNVAIVQKEAPTIADIARAALQEAGDE